MHRYGLDKLNAKERVLLGLALLLDGHEAQAYLENDKNYAGKFQEPLSRIAELPTEIRVPYVGTLVRRALDEL